VEQQSKAVQQAQITSLREMESKTTSAQQENIPTTPDKVD
jgi:hypothetical protein